MGVCTINPVMLKEMRQSVRGMFISILLVLTLLINAVFISSELIFNKNIGLDFTIAQRLFGQIYFMLMLVGFILIPAYIAGRFSGEISDKQSSLFFSTSLSPSQIIWGKFCSGAALIVIFYCTVLPFLVLLYFLRGIDVAKMLTTVFHCFTLSLLAIMFMLAFNSNTLNPGLRKVKYAIGIIVLIFLSSYVSGLYYFVNNQSESILTFTYWAKILTYLALEILMGIFLFVISVYKISPKLSNRAFAVKLFSLIFWLLTGLILLTWSRSNVLAGIFNDTEPLSLWLFSMTIIFVIAMVASAIEPDNLSRRVKASISPGRFVRPLQYLFYSGCANTFVFCCLMAVLTVAASAIFELAGLTENPMDTLRLAALTLYGSMYGLMTIAVKRRFFNDKPNTAIPAIITAVLVLMGTITPVLIAFYSYDSISLTNASGWYAVGNPLIPFYDNWPILKVLFFTSVLTVFLAAFNWKWFYASFKEFTPPD
jgi:hypothetical protein